MKQQKQKYLENIFPQNPPKFFNIIVYVFMLFLTMISFEALKLLKTSEPFESLILLLILSGIVFWILKESILRIHWLYCVPGILFAVAIIVNDSNVMFASIKIILILLVIYLLDSFGLITKFIRICNEIIKK